MNTEEKQNPKYVAGSDEAQQEKYTGKTGEADKEEAKFRRGDDNRLEMLGKKWKQIRDPFLEKHNLSFSEDESRDFSETVSRIAEQTGMKRKEVLQKIEDW